MPKYKNSFKSPRYIEEVIFDSEGKTIGTIRIKPVSVAWKPAGQGKYFTVKLDDFTNWITGSGIDAQRRSS